MKERDKKPTVKYERDRLTDIWLLVADAIDFLHAIPHPSNYVLLATEKLSEARNLLNFRQVYKRKD